MSKLLMFDFECSCGHRFEDLVSSDTHSTKCPSCEAQAERVISAVRLDWRRMGIDTAFTTCADKWEAMQRSKPRDDNPNLVMY